jgi:hypothetical protein
MSVADAQESSAEVHGGCASSLRPAICRRRVRRPVGCSTAARLSPTDDDGRGGQVRGVIELLTAKQKIEQRSLTRRLVHPPLRLRSSSSIRYSNGSALETRPQERPPRERHRHHDHPEQASVSRGPDAVAHTTHCHVEPDGARVAARPHTAARAPLEAGYESDRSVLVPRIADIIARTGRRLLADERSGRDQDLRATKL